MTITASPSPSTGEGAVSYADAVVVGAGFSGLYMLHRLRDDLGLRVRAFEAGAGVGGTWYWNRYPGARCDSDAMVYCYSFDKELLQEWQWSGKYPEQPELLSYLEHVAERYDLSRDFTFNTKVTSAYYNERTSTWTVTTDAGERVEARFFITGIGHLTTSKYVPSIPGLDGFAGQWHHTGAWPPQGVDFTGKRVGVIGTGSSGVQSIPVIAEQARELYVFQRTPQYSVPARHETVDARYWIDVKSHYDEIWDRARNSAGGFPWQHNGKRALDVGDDERLASFEAGWAEGGIKFALGSYRDLTYDLDANKTVSDFVRQKIREVVKDPVTREKLIPPHPFLARRVIVDTNYYETYNKNSVHLVDVRETPITEVTAQGVKTTDAEYPLDVLVFATGFDAVTGPFFGIDIRGRGGVPLTDKWAAGPMSYLGLQTSGFPNMLMITGPGSTLGNLPLSIETHVDWIADCVAHLLGAGLSTIETTEDVEKAWSQDVNKEAERSVIRLADSWFTGANIPGKPRSYFFYFGHFGKYRARLAAVAAAGYDGFVLS